jgi:flagellar L-ring protein precursor FlgH
MNKLISSLSIAIVASLLNGCTTYVENQASLEFDPIYLQATPQADSASPTGGIYKASSQGLFATDVRARGVGDILTVTLAETFTATKSQSTSSSKADGFDIDLPVGVPNLLTGGLSKQDDAFKMGTAQSFAGAGAAAQSNSLTGFLTVMVTRVFDNGNMEIMGQKKLRLNNGDEYIRLTGLIRPEDVSATNLIASHRIADAEIVYVGAGEIADSGRQGWLSRGMRAISPL